MNVTVRTFADFRELLGKELVISLPDGQTVRELLQVLGKRHAAFLPGILEDDGQLRPYVNILENGRNVRFLDDLETRLAEGDIIAIFPPVAGG
ncbi:MAG: MoaD/ThiS family protein [Acidobacteriia bacterium]|nr:MoaD/ThiS family protein [Terriglobia bacterium]